MPGLPLPPPELAGYVLGLGQADPEAHVAMGALLADAVTEFAGPAFAWDGTRVLDFGCGPGRVLRHLAERTPRTELHGAELDEACVAWIAEHLSPPLHAVACGPEPPLPYPDAHFDLIWAVAVFGHITDAWAAWLLELRRVLRPGASLLATVMGESHSERLADEPWEADRVGMNVRGVGRPFSSGGPMILHSEWWIRAHWGRAFTVERFEPGAIAGQDAVVLRRDERPAPTVEELLAPEPDEPRELRAARHAIDRLQRDQAALNAQHDAYAAAYAEEAERHRVTQERAARLEVELAEARAMPPGRDRRARDLAATVRRRVGARGSR